MDVVELPTPWIAEDDLLLKNAIEAGASLEALAKGAVRFSRRFTLSELRDRWHSLLYDPCESVRASIRISEVANFNGGHTSMLCKIGNIKENSDKNVKRKPESVRRKFYAMRKRIRAQLIDDDSFDFLGACIENEHADQGIHDHDNHLKVDQMAANDNSLHGNHIMTNSGLLEFGQETAGLMKPVEGNVIPKLDSGNMKMPPNYDLMYSNAADICPKLGEQGQQIFNSHISDELHSVELSSPTSRDPLWKMTEDIFAPVLPISTDPRDKTLDAENIPSILGEDHGKLIDPYDCMPNSTSEGGHCFMDVDGSASVVKSSLDNLNSMILSSPIYTHDGFVPIDSSSITKDAIPALVFPVATSPTSLDISLNSQECGIDNQNNVCLDARICSCSSSSTQKLHCSDIQDINTPCILNTEVEEVPNNDDVFPMGIVAATQTLSQKPSAAATIIGCQKDIEQALDKDVKSISQPVIVLAATVQLLKTCSNHATQPSIQAEFPKASELVGKHAQNSQLMPENRKAARSNGSDAVRDVEGKTSVVDFKKPDLSDMKSEDLALPEQMSEPLSPGEEELESDDDVPYFSDVEAMVLEMDLCTDDQDPFTCTRVSQYQDGVSKKQIARLELCARSYMDRRMESHGAFAILYGRRLKYYVKKPEVILGRSTEDMEVDVDLAREGHANKISRQQASIKLEADGSFILTNRGKFNISINGIDLATGQFVTLGISNLIEIRGMGFTFEANQKSVHRFLTSVGKVSRGLACKEGNRWTVGASNRCQTSKHLKV